MKTIFNKLNNLTIRTFGATEVDLPQLDDDVEITYYAKNGLIGIRHKMSYSEKLIPCDDLDALVKALTVTEPSSKTAEGKDNKSMLPENTI